MDFLNRFPLRMLNVIRSKSADPSLSVTVYSGNNNANFDLSSYLGRMNEPGIEHQIGGFAMIAQEAPVSFTKDDLMQPIYRGAFEDVAALLDPTTVSFTFLDTVNQMDGSSSNECEVLEQNYQFDVLSTERMLDYFVGGDLIEVALSNESDEIIRGRLLSHSKTPNGSSGSTLLLEEEGTGSVRIVPSDGAKITMPSLPSSLYAKPTLELRAWIPSSENPNVVTKDLKAIYKTGGMTWRTDYNLTLNESQDLASLGAWVSILNLSGKTFEDAEIKLIAGDVNTNTTPRSNPAMFRMQSDVASAPMERGFEERELFEYHLYTLPRPANLRNASLNQLTLFPTVPNLTVTTELRYSPLDGYRPHLGKEPNRSPWYPRNDSKANKVDVAVTFRNDIDSNLGMPLPQGVIRVFQQDASSAEFVGEGTIDATASGERVKVPLGSSFDVNGSRTVKDLSIDESARTIREKIEIEIRNQKDVSVDIQVQDVLYRWPNTQLTDCSPDCGQTLSQGVIRWDLTVASKSTKKMVERSLTRNVS